MNRYRKKKAPFKKNRKHLSLNEALNKVEQRVVEEQRVDTLFQYHMLKDSGDPRLGFCLTMGPVSKPFFSA